MATTSGSKKHSAQRHDSTQSSAVQSGSSISSATASLAASQSPPAAPAVRVAAAPVAVEAAGSMTHAAAAQRGNSEGSSTSSGSGGGGGGDNSKKKRKKRQRQKKKRAKRSTQQELTLWCAVVGEVNVFSVRIHASETVEDLANKIREKPTTFSALKTSPLMLFLAKDGDSWLASTHDDGVALRKGEVNGSIEVRLRDEPLDPQETIDKAIAAAGLELPPPAKHIHVLVKLPTQQTTGSRALSMSAAGDEMEEKAVTPLPPVWKPEQEPDYVIPVGDMYFVNRDAAIKQLLDIHVHKFARASSSGVGATWRIPIADNVFGLGKSELGRRYIRKCREIWAASIATSQADAQPGVLTQPENRDGAQSRVSTPPNDDSTWASLVAIAPRSALMTPPTKLQIQFWETLCACHTVRIEFDNGTLLPDKISTKVNYDEVTIGLLKTALEEMFEVPPQILANPPSHSAVFLKAVTKEVGPLFIVLDEIGRPFENRQDQPSLRKLDQRELFIHFCNDVLLSWMKLPGVFFVLLGRADFLSYVGLRPSGTLTGCTSSPFKFERLRLNLLRPAKIATIMKKTRSGEGMQSLQMFYRLNDAELMDVAKYLFMATNGHPRTLMDAFTRCQTLESLKSFVSDPLSDVEKRAMMQAIQKYRTDVEKLVKIMQPVGGVATSQLQSAVETVNMSEPIDDAGGKSLTLDIIAQNCFIAWEGTLEQATVYASPQVEEILARLTQPFRTYAAEVARLFASGYVSLDYPLVFEWMCLKRFQELFEKATTPEDALPDFFAGSKFGATKNVCFSQVPILSAKITAHGSSASVATLGSATAAPEAWTNLLKEVSSMLLEHPVTLKPKETSASADAILFCRKDSGAAPSTLMEVLTVGLAVKNYKLVTKFGLAHLKHECEIFNCMFDDDATRAVFQTNVLVLCVTSYIDNFMGMFSAEKNKDEQRKAAARSIGELSEKQREFFQFSHITEVIFLDLTTPTNRAAFFGYNTNDEVFGCLEKIIDKPNRESENQELERKQNVDE